MPAPQKIQRLSPVHVNDVIAIASKEFGGDFLEENHLNTYCNDAEKYGFVISNDTGIAGFVIGRICSGEELKGIALAEKSWFEHEFDQKKVGIIETIAVNSSCAGNGIGKTLINESVTFLKENTTSILSLVWQHPEGAPLARILEKKGFEKKRELQKYWSEDSVEKGYECLYCKQPPCICDAHAFVLAN